MFTVYFNEITLFQTQSTYMHNWGQYNVFSEAYNIDGASDSFTRTLKSIKLIYGLRLLVYFNDVTLFHT